MSTNSSHAQLTPSTPPVAVPSLFPPALSPQSVTLALKSLPPPPPDPDAALAKLADEMGRHPIWNNRLFRACEARALSRDDFRHVFAQYFAYSRNFTRYVAAVMASCPHDGLRAQLTENLWEEGGGADPEERHAEIFRRFLAEALDVREPDRVELDAPTRIFVSTYLTATRSEDHIYATAFLSLGTEAIVSRMYRVFVDGLRSAGLSDEQLRFFHLHIAADDDHAETLQRILAAFHDQPGWLERARRGMNDALEARRVFFEALYAQLEAGRYARVVERIRAKSSLMPADAAAEAMRTRPQDPLDELYANEHERLNIQFTVAKLRAPGAEALDPRLVRIPAGKFNERHQHAHESLFVIMAGVGEVLVGEAVVPVKAGDIVFVPRWVFHQTRNTGASEMVVVAVTDFGLTSAVLGNYDRATRARPR